MPQTMVSGPKPVTFGDIHALSTSAAFSTFGSYVLRLTASDGAPEPAMGIHSPTGS